MARRSKIEQWELNRIKQLKKDGLTSAYLAQKFNLSVGTVNRIIKGYYDE